MNRTRTYSSIKVLILFFGNILYPSGTAERIYQISKRLQKMGINVTMASKYYQQGTYIDFNRDLKGITIIPLPKTLLNILGLMDWIAKIVSNGIIQKYDIAQIESFPIPLIIPIYILLRPFTKHFVIVLHDISFKKSKKSLCLLKIIIRLVDAIITPGEKIKKSLEHHIGLFANKKTIVIPNGVTLELGSLKPMHEVRRKYKLPSSAFIAMFFGSMDFPPNFEAAMWLYNISEQIAKKFKNITGDDLLFVVAGPNSERLPKNPYYLPLGFIKKFEDLLSIPDVFVLPHLESYSGPHVKTIYCFLSGKPVVATNDAIKDMPGLSNEHILIFDIKKPSTLLDSLLMLKNNHEISKKMALNAYCYAKKFSWRRIAYMHIRLYEHLLNEKYS